MRKPFLFFVTFVALRVFVVSFTGLSGGGR